MLELATACYRAGDAVILRAARSRENFSDLLAEARARARGHIRGERPSARGARDLRSVPAEA